MYVQNTYYCTIHFDILVCAKLCIHNVHIQQFLYAIDVFYPILQNSSAKCIWSHHSLATRPVDKITYFRVSFEHSLPKKRAQSGNKNQEAPAPAISQPWPQRKMGLQVQGEQVVEVEHQ
jgi:hypothetical protein